MWTWIPTSQTTVFLPSPPLQPHSCYPKFTKTLSCIPSNSNPKSPKHKPKPNPENQDKQVISGSDLLWAWQRASTEKRMKKNKRKKQQLKNMNYSKQWTSDNEDGDDSSEWSDVKPLCIESDWERRLDQLEKRLQELKVIV